MKVLLSTLNAKYIHSALALYSLKANARQAEPDIAVVEYTINQDLSEIVSDLYSRKPDVLGLACYIWNIEMTLDLVRLVRQVMPETLIVLGGPEVTYDAVSFMERIPEVDYLIMGEGEQVFAALLTALKSGAQSVNIPGVLFRNEGQVCGSSEPQIVADLDSLAFPYEEEDWELLSGKILYYEAARGCPYSCQYCLSSASLGVRYRSLDHVLPELSQFVARNVKQVKFVDRTFNARKEHFFPIWQFLAAQSCRTNFHFEITADTLDAQVVDCLASVPGGRFQFEIGVQSTYEPALAEIQRHNHWDRLTANVQALLSHHNIHLHLDLIAGLPYETLEQFGHSFDDVYHLHPHMLQLGFLKMLRGSGIRRHADKHGYIFMKKAPYEVLSNRYVSYGDLRRLKRLEQVLDIYYNSGRFTNTVAALLAETGLRPFLFYQGLADWWEEHDYHKQSHALADLYAILFAFLCEKNPDFAQAGRDWMKLDILLGELTTVRPAVLHWNNMEWSKEKDRVWRNVPLMQTYFPSYEFTNWRLVKKEHPIEVFDFDVLTAMETGMTKAPPKKLTPVLFASQGPVRYFRLKEEDFWMSED